MYTVHHSRLINNSEIKAEELDFDERGNERTVLFQGLLFDTVCHAAQAVFGPHILYSPHVLENRHKAPGLASEDRYQACIWPFLLFKESNPVKKQKEKPREVHQNKEPGEGARFKLGAKKRKQWQHARNAFKGLWKSQAVLHTSTSSTWWAEPGRWQSSSQPRQYK